MPVSTALAETVDAAAPAEAAGDEAGSVSGSSDEDEDEEARQLREAAHARRAERRLRWEEAGRQLDADGYAVMDGFMGAAAAEALLHSVEALRDSLAAYKYLVEYFDENAVEDMDDEAQICREMAQLLPRRIEMVAK